MSAMISRPALRGSHFRLAACTAPSLKRLSSWPCPSPREAAAPPSPWFCPRRGKLQVEQTIDCMK
eukprot:1552783-Pyramimonas_sp.AAC.1